MQLSSKNLMLLKIRSHINEQIKIAAEKAGETVNGYIKKAIDERMSREMEE